MGLSIAAFSKVRGYEGCAPRPLTPVNATGTAMPFSAGVI